MENALIDKESGPALSSAANTEEPDNRGKARTDRDKLGRSSELERAGGPSLHSSKHSAKLNQHLFVNPGKAVLHGGSMADLRLQSSI